MTEAQTPALKACPECKSSNVVLCEPNYADEGGTMIVCLDCDCAGDSFDLGKYGEGRAQAIAAWNTRAKPALEPVAWMPIETAPRDGTVIDVWRNEGGRSTVYWGLPLHTCGEMGEHCDSDWHAIKNPGWVCSTFGEFCGGKHNPFTHWMPLPPPPGTAHPPADRALLDEVREALDLLQCAEAEYRKAHDLYGGDDIRTGRAWDAMRRAGDKARTKLEALK